MEKIGNVEITEDMRQQEEEMLEGTAGEKQQGTKELAVVQEGAVAHSSDKKLKSMNYTHMFRKPVEILGKQYKAMTFYFEKLTGEDIEAVEQEMQDMNKYAISPEVSSTFQCMLAARAAGVGSDEIRRLPLPDYMKIKNKTRDFLTSAGY